MYIISRSDAIPVLGIKRVRAFVYRKENLIGEGGYSKIYAQRGRAGIPLAIKITKRNHPGLKKWGDAFIEREGKALLMFDHPNIVKGYAHGKCFPPRVTRNPRHFLAMEAIPETHVTRLFNKGVIPSLEIALEILEKIAGALAHVHDKGWVHSDVKPENIRVNIDDIKLMDFAGAREEGKLVRPEGPKWAFGTFEYRSLSRLKKLPPTREDDLFALGITFCEILLGPHVPSRYEYLEFKKRALLSEENVDKIFTKSQERLRQLINESPYPRQVKELMRKLTCHPRRMPFTDCHEVIAFARKIREESRLKHSRLISILSAHSQLTSIDIEKMI